MNSKIEEYVAKRKRIIEKEQFREKAQKLADLGVCKKVYSQQEQASEEYPFEGEARAYNYDIGVFTDEEYKEALNYAPVKKTIHKKRLLAFYLIWIGIHFILLFWGTENWNPGFENFFDIQYGVWPFSSGELHEDYDISEFLVYSCVPLIIYWVIRLFKESRENVGDSK